MPQRLLTIVLAPLERVARVIESNDILGRLFGNGWVTLVAIDPHSGRARCWRRRQGQPDASTDNTEFRP